MATRQLYTNRTSVLFRELTRSAGATLVGQVGYNGGTYTAPTVTRASTINCLGADGYFDSYTANQVPLYKGLGIFCEPAHTNSIPNSNYSDGSVGAGVTITTGQWDIFGTSTGVYLDDSSASQTAFSAKSISATRTSGEFNSVRIFVKKQTSINFRHSFYIDPPGSGVYYFSFSPESGATTDITANSNAEVSVDEITTADGNYWVVTITVEAASGSGDADTFLVSMSPARALESSPATGDVAAVGRMYIGHIDIFLDTAHNIARHLSPIVTTGAAATTDACQYYDTGVLHLPTSGLLSVGVIPLLDEADFSEVSTNQSIYSQPTLSSTPVMTYLHSSGVIKSADGSTYLTIDPNISSGTTYVCTVVYDADEGSFNFRVNDSWYGTTNFDGGMGSSADDETLRLAANANPWAPVSPFVITYFQQHVGTYDKMITIAEELS